MKVQLDANDVAAYLKAHPDFFNLYADLLAQIVITDPHNGRAISITERQLGALRDRNKQLEAKLAELIGFGEENDAIGGKLHQMTLALLRAQTFAQVLQAVHEHLEGPFAVPHVALRLWPDADLSAWPEQAGADEATQQLAASLKRPYCGACSDQTALSWLDGSLRSLALMPLKQGEACMGLLALGSEDPQRFYSEMDTLFLGRIAEVVTTAIQRTLSAAGNDR